MQNFLLNAMEFVIEMAVATAAIGLITVGIAIGFLYATGMYKNKRAAIIAPMIIAMAVGATWLTDYTSVGQWAYFTIPATAITPLFVSNLCYRKRLRDKGYYSGTE